MKRFLLLFLILMLTLCACTPSEQSQVAATTLPVYEFTARLCSGTPITVTRLVTESVSCLHDYTLQIGQMQRIEGAQVVVRSGAGLEDFLEDALSGAQTVIDASAGLSLIEGEHDHDHTHVHADDPHIWLSPENAKTMAHNICHGLSLEFPEFTEIFEQNLTDLTAELDALLSYGEQKLRDLSCRELVTFHDGFSYFAESFGLHILKAVEEESGAEASAAELIELITLVEEHSLPAIFTEINGADAAAGIVARETGVKIFTLDMAMSGSSYFTAMRHNIDTVWEALQ